MRWFLCGLVCLFACAGPVADRTDDPVGTDDQSHSGADDDTVDRPDTDIDGSDTDDTRDPDDTDTVPAPFAGCVGKPTGTAIGDCSPDFNLLDKSGVRHRLSDLRGRVVSLDISAMWCPFCRQAAPHGEQLHTSYGPDVAVLTVLYENLDSEDPSADDLDVWVTTYKLTHPVVGDEDRGVRDAWGGSGKPTLAVLDRDGRVTFRSSGALVEDWEEAIQLTLVE